MKTKEISFLQVQKNAKKCKRVRKDMKRKGLSGGKGNCGDLFKVKKGYERETGLLGGGSRLSASKHRKG
jgi:hypothetical protein